MAQGWPRGVTCLQSATPCLPLAFLVLSFTVFPVLGFNKIRPRLCTDSRGHRGTCMFAYECLIRDGRPLGTCKDGFLFGSCCNHDDYSNLLQPESDESDFPVTSPATSATSEKYQDRFGVVSAQLHLITSITAVTTARPVTSNDASPQLSSVVTSRPSTPSSTWWYLITKGTVSPNKRPTTRRPVIITKRPFRSTTRKTITHKTTVRTNPPTKETTTVSTNTHSYTTTVVHSVTQKPSTENKQLIKNCGIPRLNPQQRIVGGSNAAFGAWPWQASVRRTAFYGFASTHRCGGAVLSEKWIATAGHCVDDLLLSQIRIRVGEYDFSSVNEPFPFAERSAQRKVVHPKYNFYTYDNDLALVQLDRPLDLSLPHIGSICLPPTDDLLVGQNATVTGWGRLSEGGVLPMVLQEVVVPIVSNDKCKQMFENAGRPEVIPDIMMCAGYENGGKDSCQGDSGGPMQVKGDDGRWFLSGIISWGIGCGDPNLPGVCTRISKFRDWILQNAT